LRFCRWSDRQSRTRLKPTSVCANRYKCRLSAHKMRVGNASCIRRTEFGDDSRHCRGILIFNFEFQDTSYGRPIAFSLKAPWPVFSVCFQVKSRRRPIRQAKSTPPQSLTRQYSPSTTRRTRDARSTETKQRTQRSNRPLLLCRLSVDAIDVRPIKIYIRNKRAAQSFPFRSALRGS
jgi:hypothetical protein